MTRSIVLLALLAGSRLAHAEPPVVELTIRDHLFEPAQLTVPANTRFRLRVRNADPTPEEFESYELNREKVIMGHSDAVIFIGPLAPGHYPFFGEFNPQTAQGGMTAR